MKLGPLDLWRANEGAKNDFDSFINGSMSRMAISLALADYQREVAHLPDGAAMLRGANGIVERLLNMGNITPTRKPIQFGLPEDEPLTIKRK